MARKYLVYEGKNLIGEMNWKEKNCYTYQEGDSQNAQITEGN